MAISKAQKARVLVTCKCGCNEDFMAFPLYDRGKGKGLRTPEYKRGHHPRCHKGLNKKGKSSWNAGLTKKDNPAVGRQGAKKEKHWRYDPGKNPDWFSDDFDHVAFAKIFGDKPRCKGNKTYAKFRRAIMERDEFTCRDCGMVADEFEESDLLNVHHIVFVKHDKTRIFDPKNVTTLCYPCHRKVHKNK